MGNFFTSTQIFNNKKLSKDQFVDKFCKKMAEDGYVACDSDESELSYILRFADNCKWVTITSEAYEQGNQTSQKDTGRIAKMLGTNCVNTVVIDSDCAIMVLYDEKGKKADTLILGRADDYFGDDIPQPSEKIWKPFLSKDGTWKQFNEVRNGDYVFVEEGLSKLAPIIGMDAFNITFSAEDADESDKYEVFLDFKKARSAITMSQGGKTVNNPAKKLTINAAFKQIFGKKLKPLGFKKIKGKNPYYVRMINDEIIHVISFYTEKDGDYQAYTVIGGIATLYRKKIDFSVRPSWNMEWLGSLSKYYLFSEPSDYNVKYDDLLNKVYLPKSADNDKLLLALSKSLEDVIKWMLPILDNVNTIDDAVIFYLNYHSDCFGLRKDIFDKGLYPEDSEIMLLSQIKNQDDIIEKYINKLKRHNEFEVKIGRTFYQVDTNKAKGKLIESIKYLKSNKKYLDLADEYKARNIEILNLLEFE